MIMVTFVDSKKRIIKRVFERTFNEDDSTIGVVGRCDCYKNSCDCVTISKISNEWIRRIEKIQVVEGDSK